MMMIIFWWHSDKIAASAKRGYNDLMDKVISYKELNLFLYKLAGYKENWNVQWGKTKEATEHGLGKN